MTIDYRFVWLFFVFEYKSYFIYICVVKSFGTMFLFPISHKNNNNSMQLNLWIFQDSNFRSVSKWSFGLRCGLNWWISQNANTLENLPILFAQIDVILVKLSVTKCTLWKECQMQLRSWMQLRTFYSHFEIIVCHFCDVWLY